MKKNLADRIKSARRAKGFTQKDVGERLGISDRAVSKWENGIARPSVENLFALAGILGVSVDYFEDKAESAKWEREAERVSGMESITELYRIGRGPSSSHTIAPERACKYFSESNPDAVRFKAVLYGSLAKTGKGHGTDDVIRKAFYPKECEVVFNYTETDIPHPNTMDIFAYAGEKIVDKARILSVGGGSFVRFGEQNGEATLIYPHASFSEIAKYCREKQIRLWEYAESFENAEFADFMQEIWYTMKQAIKRGIDDDGILPGGLEVHKRAKYLYNSQHIDETAETRENRIVCAYAFAVGEQNASGETIVTAPTCGAAGVLPAVLYYQQQKNRFSDIQIIHALTTAGIVGNLIKTNASISGAECGCQAEIGSACSMAAAALAELFELSIDKIEYAAEIAMEHHLGLTCDPICGLVQIPCIERNAVAAMRAINAVNLASFLWDTRKISFDTVVKAMKETGLDMRSSYKETSEAGLAKVNIH